MLEWFEQAYDYRTRDTLQEWQRDLGALHRLSNDVMNGGYIQFLVNNGRDAYARSSRVLKQVGAPKTAAVIDECQRLIEKHFPVTDQPSADLDRLFPNEVIGHDGRTIKPAGSVLPPEVLDRIRQLSWEFIEFPEDWGVLVENHYADRIRANVPPAAEF